MTHNSMNTPTPLPELIEKWLSHSRVENKPTPSKVLLQQKGRMKTSPKGKWMKFTANQEYRVKEPAFLWEAKVELFPFVHLSGRDELKNGRGEMLIKLLSFIAVVHEKDNYEVNTGTLLRYLGEICWFPQAAREPYLRWETIGEKSARAYFTQGDLTVEGLFSFSSEGRLLSFEAMRYYGGEKPAKLREWYIEILEEKDFEGSRLPSHCRVTWKLPEGDFDWLELQVTKVQHEY
ncbi:DUF6920 family protein [Salinimicrobium soli]